MNQLTAIKRAPLTSLAQRFADDLNAAFAGDESGSVYKYLYLDPREIKGSSEIRSGLAQTLATSNHYYVFKNGLWLVNTYAAQWADKVGKGRPMVEFGVGTGKALEKTKALVEALQPSSLTINDNSADYLQKDKAELHKSFPRLPVKAQAGDFLALPPKDMNTQAPVAFLQGCTLSNYDDVPGVLRHIASLAGPGADIFVDFDANQDVQNLELAYGSPAQIEQRKQILRYAQEVFAPEGFDPEAFEWQCEWRAKEHLLLQKLVPTEPQSFTIDGVYHQNPNGIVVSKMYKHPVAEFNALAQKAGLSVSGIYRDFEGKIAMAHLKPRF